jgi:hypothetical protein
VQCVGKGRLRASGSGALTHKPPDGGRKRRLSAEEATLAIILHARKGEGGEGRLRPVVQNVHVLQPTSSALAPHDDIITRNKELEVNGGGARRLAGCWALACVG